MIFSKPTEGYMTWGGGGGGKNLVLTDNGPK